MHFISPTQKLSKESLFGIPSKNTGIDKKSPAEAAIRLAEHFSK